MWQVAPPTSSFVEKIVILTDVITIQLKYISFRRKIKQEHRMRYQRSSVRGHHSTKKFKRLKWA